MKGTSSEQSLVNAEKNSMVLMRARFAIHPGRSIPSVLLPLSVFVCLLAAGCASTPSPAPVVERAVTEPQKPASRPGTAREADTHPKSYVVQKGDTLYSIALNHGLDYKDLVEWNGISDPGAITVGQQLNLSAPAQQAQPTLFALPQPVLPPAAPRPIPVPEAQPDGGMHMLTTPKGLKLPYSEQAVARLQASAETPPAAAKIESASEKVAKIETEAPPPAAEINPDNIEWIWPAAGRILDNFSESAKGINIAGKSGQPVLASAAGRVVYSGIGLRGYGKLIIIKHNDTYLSAYAHNSKILAKEGQTVAKGQKIAEMGDTDADSVKLHFEIRKHGKPVDPLKYLPGVSE